MLLKLDMVLKTVRLEPSEYMRADLEQTLGKREDVKSEIVMRESWRWRLDG